MQCLIGIDDTDSARGLCTTYLAYRVAVDLRPEVQVLPYPRLVRLNPNIPFKTRGNAAVCLPVEVGDPELAFELVSAKVRELSDVGGGANSGMVFLDRPGIAASLSSLYSQALVGVVHPARVRRLLAELGIRSLQLGNGMGVVGAASSLAFDARLDHTYELISYRRERNWGTRRFLDSSSVRKMDAATFPHTFNNYDYQKRKVLVCPHGPDPVFAGVRGDSPGEVLRAFGMLRFDESLQGHMVFESNQHTDAHLRKGLEWKAYSSGWLTGTVESVEVGPGGHAYVALDVGGRTRVAAAYEPTGDLKRIARLLRPGDEVRAYGGVRRPTSLHPKVLNLEKLEVLSLARGRRTLRRGTYISSTRANRHLTKPLTRYGLEGPRNERAVEGWLAPSPIRQLARARSR
jgi:tRNA(Ile2)-agmatinylcytidine synthase